MLPVMISLCFTHGRLDIAPANVSTDTLGMYDCFTQTVDMDWRYSQEESWRVSHFMNYTDNRCDKRYWRVFECYFPFLQLYYQAEHSLELGHKYAESYELNKEITEVTKMAELFEMGLVTKQRLIYDIEKLTVISSARNEDRILSDNCSKMFFDLENLKNELEHDTRTVCANQLYLQSLVEENQDRNISSGHFVKKPMDIFECFTQTVDVDWRYSEAESWRVTRFLNYTERRCDILYWRLFECYYSLLELLNEESPLYFLVTEHLTSYYVNKSIHGLEKGVKIWQKRIDIKTSLIHDLQEITDIATARNDSRVLNDNCSKVFFDLKTLRHETERDLQGVHSYQVYLEFLTHGNISVGSDQQFQDIDFYNVSGEPQEIFECFSQAVNVLWWFSIEETRLVFRFLNYTNGTCDVRYWREFQCYYPLLQLLREAERSNALANEHFTRYKEGTEIHGLDVSLELTEKGNRALERLVYVIEEVIQLAAVNNESRTFSDDCSGVYFDLKELYHQVGTNVKTLDGRKAYRQWLDILVHYLPTFYLVMFIFGIFGNGFLLHIFIRHRELRKGPNLLLANLAVSDSLLLIIQLTFEWCIHYWNYPLGHTVCYFYTFARTSSIAASVYSMTAMSVIRFVATTNTSPTDGCRKVLTSIRIMIGGVWTSAAVAAIPDTINTNPGCTLKYTLLSSISNFVVISFLPLIVIAGFSFATSRRLRNSARNMPGEAMGHAKARCARERGAKILPVFAMLFAVTYLPIHSYWAVLLIINVNKERSLHLVRLYAVVYIAINVNAALNPVGLYLSSSTFRQHFNKYLFKAVITRCRS